MGGFATLTEARTWVLAFVKWYNLEHRHSGLNFLTPHQRHSGIDKAVLENRRKIYERAKAAHPERWTRGLEIGLWKMRFGLIQNELQVKIV
jgi:putative transposase